MNTRHDKPSAKSQTILETLKTAVHKAVDRKKRLGQYAVYWINNKPALIGDDAPKYNNKQQ